MTMDVEKMRSALIELYTGPNWKLKVQGMPDRQVIAIYKDMERKGRFKQKNKRKKREPKKQTAIQITIYDVLYGKTPLA